MHIDKDALEKIVNLHTLQPGFLNSELHYVLAKSPLDFKFTNWKTTVDDDAKLYYCFLTDQPLHISAGDITVDESYTLSEDPIYPIIASFEDFCILLDDVRAGAVVKGIRQFEDETLEQMRTLLSHKYGNAELHVVSSRQGQHTLLIFDNIEVSVANTMVYFRPKTIVNREHYAHIAQEKSES